MASCDTDVLTRAGKGYRGVCRTCQVSGQWEDSEAAAQAWIRGHRPNS